MKAKYSTYVFIRQVIYNGCKQNSENRKNFNCCNNICITIRIFV